MTKILDRISRFATANCESRFVFLEYSILKKSIDDNVYNENCLMIQRRATKQYFPCDVVRYALQSD